MYKVYCDDALMCDSSLEELALINPVVTLEENKAGSFSFVLVPQHPYYDRIKRRTSEIKVFRNNEDHPLFCGICVNYKDGFYKRRTFECEGELTYLNDSVQRPARYQNYTVRGLLEAYIAAHNEQVEEKKRFKVGVVTVKDSNNSLYRYTNMNTTLQEIKEDLVDDLGGIIKIRHEGQERFIDYLSDGMNTNTQNIRFGENLLDFTTEMDSSDIATAVIPLGNLLDEEKVEGLQTRLTIESVNDGKDYVFDQNAVNTYGWITKTVTFDQVTTPGALKTKGEQYLSDIQFEKMVIEATAFDMGLAEDDVEKFKISDYIQVVSEPHGMNRRFRLTKMTLHLNEPGTDKFTLGKEEQVSLSVKANQTSQTLQKAIESTPTEGKLLKEAQKNASNLIKTATSGIIKFVYDDDGHPKELLIMDTDDINTAEHVWRFNINGLGYSGNGYNGDYDLAITMDGKVVATEVAAENLTGETIKGKRFVADGKAEYHASDYTQADIDKINQYILHPDTIDLAALDKYDINGSGTLTIADLAAVNRMLKGSDPDRVFDVQLEIYPNNRSCLLAVRYKRKEESEYKLGITFGRTGIAVNDMHAVYMRGDRYYTKDDSGTEIGGVSGTVESGDMITITNGICTGIVKKS